MHFFLLHVGSLYLWHKSLFLCNHCFFLSFNFCKKKKKSIILISMSLSAVCAIIGTIVTKPAFVWFHFISDGK